MAIEYLDEPKTSSKIEYLDEPKTSSKFEYLDEPEKSLGDAVSSAARPISGILRKFPSAYKIITSPFILPFKHLRSLDDKALAAKESFKETMTEGKTLFPALRGVTAGAVDTLVPTPSEAIAGVPIGAGIGKALPILGKVGAGVLGKMSKKLGKFVSRDVSSFPVLNKLFPGRESAEPLPKEAPGEAYKPTFTAEAARRADTVVEREAEGIFTPQANEALARAGIDPGKIKLMAKDHVFGDPLPPEFDNLPPFARKMAGDLIRASRNNLEYGGSSGKIAKPLPDAGANVLGHEEAVTAEFMKGMENIAKVSMQKAASESAKPGERIQAIAPKDEEDILKILDDAPILPRRSKIFGAAVEFGRSGREPTKYIPEVANPVVRNFEIKGNVIENFGVRMASWKKVLGKENSYEDRLAGIILDRFPQEDIISKGVDAVVPPEISKLLSEPMKRVIREQAVSLRTIAVMGGLEPEKFLKNYLTHIVDYTRKFKMAEEAQVAGQVLQEGSKVSSEKVLNHFGLPKELYNRFFQTRTGSESYSLSSLRAFQSYMFPGLRKAYMEPLLGVKKGGKMIPGEVMQAYLKYKNGDPAKGIPPNPDKAKEALVYINDTFGRNPNPSFNLDRVHRGLLGRYYEATLWGNPASAIKNLTQLANTIIDIGPKWAGVGIRKLMSEEGRGDFAKSGIIFRPVELGAKTVGTQMSRLDRIGDFMSHAEYLLRGVTYLGEKARQLEKLGPDKVVEAGELARKAVQKLQFSVSAADLPRLFRGKGRLLFQFKSFNQKQLELVNTWIQDKEYGKVASFIGLSYAFGGPRSVIPAYDSIREKLPKEWKDKVDKFDEKSNVPGALGVDLSDSFGIGLFNIFSLPPVLSVAKKGYKLASDVYEGKVRTPEEFIGPVADIASMHVKGGVIAKKLVEGGINAYRGSKLDARERVVRRVTPMDSIKRIFIGTPKGDVEEAKQVRATSLLRERMQNERNRIVDMFIEGDRDEAVSRLTAWNSDPDKPKIKLDIEDLRREAELKKLTRRERQLKAAPRSLRIFEAVRDR